ncbi:Uncharacterised protein [Escherichia coli]|nr:hypothetical protein BvCmsNSNP016_02260 [Escherichia coli]SQN70210.1 Uncharacterised protein [Escherichia coli]
MKNAKTLIFALQVKQWRYSLFFYSSNTVHFIEMAIAWFGQAIADELHKKQNGYNFISHAATNLLTAEVEPDTLAERENLLPPSSVCAPTNT